MALSVLEEPGGAEEEGDDLSSGDSPVWIEQSFARSGSDPVWMEHSFSPLWPEVIARRCTHANAWQRVSVSGGLDALGVLYEVGGPIQEGDDLSSGDSPVWMEQSFARSGSDTVGVPTQMLGSG